MQLSVRASVVCVLAAAVALSGAYAQPTSFPKVRWCVDVGAKADCDALLPLIEVNVTLAGIFIGTFDEIIECVEFTNCDDPVNGPLATGQAEIGSDIDGGLLFELSLTGKLITLIASEDEGDVLGQPADIRGYYGTPIVRKDSPLCSAPTLTDALSGVRTCHTGFQRTAGWKIPVGNLIECDVLPEVCDYCGGDHAAASLAAFVGSACVPGAKDLGGVSGINETLCANCIGEGEDFCSQNDPYSGYQGAFRCLVEDSGDVAFIRQSTIDTYSGANTPEWATEEIDRDDFMILCKEGGCVDIDDFETCNWAQTIFHTTILVFEFPQSGMIEILRAGFEAASALPAVQEYFNGGPKQGVLFDPGTTKLVRIDDPIETYAEALFTAFEELEEYDNGEPCTKYKWCVDPDYLSSCEEMLMVANLTDLIECFPSDDCQSADGPLVTGEAHITSNVDGGPYFELFKAANLQPVVSEDEGDALGEPAVVRGYFGIAVVDTGSPLCGLPFAEAVQGSRTCHTGYQRTAGWRIPVGTLLELGVLPQVIDNDVPNDLASMEAFVASACVPGATPVSAFNSSLCLNCIGEGDAFCSNSDDPYQDYEGSFRCLADGNGDIAFIRQTTIPNFSGPNTPPEWGLGELNPDDYEILCPDGSGCVSLDEFESCALAQNIFHTTIINQCIPTEDVEIIQQKLMDASMGNPAFNKFLAGGSDAGFIFEDGTTKLVPIPEDAATYGGALFLAFEDLDDLNARTCTELCGDVNNDNNITVSDVVQLTNFVIGLVTEIGCLLESGNLNGDESITVQDIIFITSIVVGTMDPVDMC